MFYQVQPSAYPHLTFTWKLFSNLNTATNHWEPLLEMQIQAQWAWMGKHGSNKEQSHLIMRNPGDEGS